jgi:putative addiction module killer protein
VKYEIAMTTEFKDWLDSLTIKMRGRVEIRLDFVSTGHLGMHKRFDELIELKWFNGVRVYVFIFESKVIVALNGGNKNGQSYDIKKDKKIQTHILNGVQTLYKPGT